MVDSYFLRARVAPTVLTSIPIISFYLYFISPHLYPILSVLPMLPTIGDVTLSGAILFLLIQVNRFISKETFQKWYFKEEIEMPTTNFLLYGNGFFTDNTKGLIRAKINECFQISLYTQEQEGVDEINARKQICLAVSQVRGYLRGNRMLLRHNIEYGFWRNLLGGCVVAVFFSILGVVFAWKHEQYGILQYFLILLIIFIIPILLSKIIINKYGMYYGKILYEQFLLTKN